MLKTVCFYILKTLSDQAPEPIEQWHKTFDATRDGPMCPQPTDDLTEVSEDCLRLNIYTQDVTFYFYSILKTEMTEYSIVDITKINKHNN